MIDPLFRCRVADRTVSVIATDRDRGSVHPGRIEADVLLDREISTTGRPWAMLDQVHGVDVVEVRAVDVDSAGFAPVVGRGDVLVTSDVVHLAVWTADCAPIVLVSDDGTVVGAHGGWRGLAAGVVDVAVSAATRSGGRVVAAVVGPVIGPCCYAFGDERLDVAEGVHADVSSISAVTTAGESGLDVPEAVRRGLRHHGIDLDVVGPCTACDDRWFSHRARSEPGRHATVAMVEP